jgi:RNA 3'-terminal phosphate cyclase (ATP)
MRDFMEIDGARGEGGGQILRTSLALSVLTGRPVSFVNVRAGRARPGLQRQHLMAVTAAAAICDAVVEGARVGATAFTFAPGALRGGEHVFDIGTAGSTSLVLQTVLLPLALAGAPARVTIAGGTHNPMAPPFEFIEAAFLPLLARLGLRVRARLVRAGFYPAGGGRVEVEIDPAGPAASLNLTEPGPSVRRRALALVANVPEHVGRREVDTLADRLGWPHGSGEVQVCPSPGPGNALAAFLENTNATEVFTTLGEKGVRAEEVAARLADEIRAFEQTGAAVGEHLADQLLLPLALRAGGVFTTVAPSLHFTTQVETLALFPELRARVATQALGDGRWRVEVAAPVAR